MNSTASGPSFSMRPIRSISPGRFGSPVSASTNAWWRSRSSSSRCTVTSCRLTTVVPSERSVTVVAIRRGAPLGRVIVRVDGRRAASVPLRAGRTVAEATALDRARSFAEENLLWLAIAASAILVAGLAAIRRLSR